VQQDKDMQKPGSLAPAAPLNVLVVDDHILVAETVVSVLSQEQGFKVDAAADVEQALEAVRRNGSYDAILLDYDVPGMDSLEGMRRLIEANGGRVALFSGVANWTMVERAIDQGAIGFIPKTLPLKSLGHAIRFIADGEIYLPADYLRRKSKGDDNGFGLRPRELQVLSLLCEGLQNKEIGRELGLEEFIVKMDVKFICRKLGARNRTQAVIAARRHGIL
jgi:two-component system, NarL family, nitrate/nitrite response regulator NarL